MASEEVLGQTIETLTTTPNIEFNLDWLVEYILQYLFSFEQATCVSYASNALTTSCYIVTFTSLIGTYYMLYNDNRSAFYIWMYTNTCMIVLNVFVRAHQYYMGIFFFVNLLMSIYGYNNCPENEEKIRRCKHCNNVIAD